MSYEFCLNYSVMRDIRALSFVATIINDKDSVSVQQYSHRVINNFCDVNIMGYKCVNGIVYCENIYKTY